jgi:hypothetical protein
MFTKIWERFEAIEECYEFMLAYTAQGLLRDQGSEAGRQVREFAPEPRPIQPAELGRVVAVPQVGGLHHR